MARSTRRISTLLWTAQTLLALIFLFAGSMKLVLPLAALQGPVAFPGTFLRFIGICETLGAVGLILPGLLRVRPELTAYAAAGLVIIMIGATVTTVIGGLVTPSVISTVVGIIAAAIAYGRGKVAPFTARAPRRAATWAVATH